MELKSEQRIELGRREVWEALNDPEILKQCIPLCDSFERLSDSEFQFSMVAAVGPVRAKFKGKITYTKVNIPVSCSMTFQGQGGAAGFGNGDADVVLADEGGATLLSYQVRAQVGGKLAQIGSRLVDAGARKIADEFFAKFNDVVVRAHPPAELGTEAAAPEPQLLAGGGSRQARVTLFWIALGLIGAGVVYFAIGKL